MSKFDKRLDPQIVSNAIFNNCYLPMIPWVNSVGFNSYQTLYNESDVLSSIAQSYLINSVHRREAPQNGRSIYNYLNDSGVMMIALNDQEDISQWPCVKLPASLSLNLALDEALVRRRSTRQFSSKSIRLSHLSTLLRAACGVTANTKVSLLSGSEVTFSLRSYPSAGALYPIDIYIAALKVDGLGVAIYRYAPQDDLLLEIAGAETISKLLKAIAVTEEQIAIVRSAVIFMLVAHPWKTMRKYGPRGLRFVLHESGAISQNINLVATALGLANVECASFYEDEVNTLLKIDGNLAGFIHAVVVGQKIE